MTSLRVGKSHTNQSRDPCRDPPVADIDRSYTHKYYKQFSFFVVIQNVTMLLYILILNCARFTWALVGYDCNGQHLNVTTVSLNSIGDCDITPIKTQDQEVYLQLLQLSEFNYAPIISCKIEISRMVYYCGMHSHISAVQNGLNEYLEDVTDQQCKRMHEDGSFSLGNNGYITGLTVNKTTTRTFTMAGTLTNDGRCTGAQFSDPY